MRFLQGLQIYKHELGLRVRCKSNINLQIQIVSLSLATFSPVEVWCHLALSLYFASPASSSICFASGLVVSPRNRNDSSHVILVSDCWHTSRTKILVEVNHLMVIILSIHSPIFSIACNMHGFDVLPWGYRLRVKPCETHMLRSLAVGFLFFCKNSFKGNGWTRKCLAVVCASAST